MSQFKQYATSTNEDGSVNIHKVEIFKLGNHKKFNYDQDWAKKAIANFNKEKSEAEFLPSVIIGHNNGKEEKPVKGYMDNLTMEGDVIYSDIVKVPKENVDEVKQFPNRSIEVNNENATITALALLGGTRPYHKFPLMEFGEDEKNTVIDFADGDLENALNRDDKLMKLRSIWWKMMEFLEHIMENENTSEADKDSEIRATLNEGKQLLDTEINNFKEGDMDPKKQFTEEQMQEAIQLTNQQFKEKYGMTPEEAVAKVNSFAEKEKQSKADAHKNSINAFAENLKKKGVAPAVVDEILTPFMNSISAESDITVTFSEDGKEATKPQLQYFQDAIEEIIERATTDKLLVPEGEMEGVEFADISEESQYSDDEVMHNKAVKQANELIRQGKYTDFNEAYQNVVFSMAGGKK